MIQYKKKPLVMLLIGLVLFTLVIPAAGFDDDLTDNSIIEIKMIDHRIEKGISYLYEKQLPNGEFSSYLSYSPDISDRKNVSVIFSNASVIFDTTFVLHTLNLARNENTREMVEEMKTKATNFLLDNQESHGLWKHMGKYSTQPPPDTDNSAMAFSALVESGINMSDESLDYMLNCTTQDGIFYTWINPEEYLDTSNPYYDEFLKNDIDANVNANVLYAYSLRNRNQDNVVRYLNGIAENRSFLNGTPYYPSPYAFTYLVTKAYSEGQVYDLEPSLGDIRNYLITTQETDGGWGNDLDTAFAANSLLNIDYKGKQLEKAIKHIQDTQKEDGSWEIHAFYIAHLSPIIYFGSEELTTSFSLEALIKYKTNLKNHRDCFDKNKVSDLRCREKTFCGEKHHSMPFTCGYSYEK